MTLTLVSRASGTVSIAKVIALQSVTTFGSYTDSSATPALGWCRDCGTESRTGSRAGGRKVEDAVLWLGSGASASEGQHVLDVLEVKPERLG